MIIWKNNSDEIIQTVGNKQAGSMKIHWDSLCGWTLGILTAVIIGKYYMVSWMDWWQVLWAIVKGQVGL